ncbi:zf-HC2 domain-containing protein [Streptomyces sp. TRM 70361]|uniref:zf-HC2 domain-containing protein n=1 Tax=Streptomyces sp. TRM 70361 TaxID=3116553 RepID=UPI002E7BDC00|nr:zf-HC2 domain-containing protein [Streptomyces sp. TRM 70361]MEE1937859.1 zf-HC2 domain-containing protein [Streptomyces sp. TRM 70361]
MNNGAANEHLDVGAYALGVLDPQDAARFEAHLATCARCSYQLSELSPLPDLLSEIAPGPAGPRAPIGPPGGVAEPEVAAPPGLLNRLLSQTAAVRRRQRRIRWALAASVAVMLAGGPAVTMAVTGQQDQRQEQSQGPGQGQLPDDPSYGSAKALFEREAERVVAKDPRTGADAEVAMWDRAWGTEVALRLKGVSGPESCDLVAVSSDGRKQTVTTWSVPEEGYGDNPLYTVGGTGLDHSEIDRFEIRTLDGDHLVTLPAR